MKSNFYFFLLISPNKTAGITFVLLITNTSLLSRNSCNLLKDEIKFFSAIKHS